MTQDKILNIRFVGDAFKPGAIKSKELGEVIGSIEDIIASVVISQHPTIAKDDISIGLLKIVDKSLGLDFLANLQELTIPAFLLVTGAIHTSHYTDLPLKALKGLRKLWSFTKNHNGEAQFSMVNGTIQKLATITPKTEIPLPPLIQGHTVLYGEITRAGGKEPHIQFASMSGGLVHCTTSRELAIEAGKILYRQVGLEGIATWNAETRKIEEFNATQIIYYEPISLKEAFSEMSPFLESIEDVDQFLQTVRYDVIEE